MLLATAHLYSHFYGNLNQQIHTNVFCINVKSTLKDTLVLHTFGIQYEGYTYSLQFLRCTFRDSFWQIAPWKMDKKPRFNVFFSQSDLFMIRLFNGKFCGKKSSVILVNRSIFFRFSFPNLKSDLQIFVLNFTYTHLNSQWWCILLGADVPFSCDKFHYDKGTLYSDYNEICSWDLKHVIIMRNRIERKKKKHFYIL